jgi:nicotinate-nucleotide adenylyltransferase
LRLGVLGGTFNPFHLGHLRSAEEIREQVELDRVLFVPAARPPHKDDPHLLPFAHRYNMVRLAIWDNPAFEATDLENHRPGKSYTIDTLLALGLSHGPDTDLFFLIGLDAFFSIHSWHQSAELFKAAHFVVFSRPEYDPETLGDYLRRLDPGFAGDDSAGVFRHPGGRTVRFCPITQVDISGHDLRRRLAAGGSVDYLVPRPVRDYIMYHQLYGAPPK